MNNIIDFALDQILPRRFRPVAIIVITVISIGLTFFGSHATRYVVVGSAFVVTLVSFGLTIPAMIPFFPETIRHMIALIVALICSVYAARSASRGSLGVQTIYALGFALGIVSVGFIAAVLHLHFTDAVPGHPFAGIVASRIAFGLAFAQAGLHAPAQTAALATAAVGATFLVHCVDLLTGFDYMRARYLKPTAKVLLTVAGYFTQTTCTARARRELGNDARVSLPYQEI